MSWSRDLGVPVPLRSLSDVVAASAGARLDVPAVITRWQPIAKSYGTICAVTLANSTVSVDGWVWNRDYSVVAETEVIHPASKLARQVPRSAHQCKEPLP
ncbi:hypothetical protein [Mobiluncus mulieris]|uniref:hypothetical protein n=1 Tax=Mobiluncus mulieris TaxID=2052 RepID=UPI00242E9AC1|nr:hypothetical protein [Mobiluncus mulieris]